MSKRILGPVSHTFFSQRKRLHYTDWGNSDAHPLLLIHGGRDHGRSWDWIAQQFSNEWHVMVPDLRGHGDSDWVEDGNYEMAAYLYDLDQLIHQQKLAPVTIISHSLGGNIALRYSGLYPRNVRAIVAIEGLGLSPKMQAELRERPLSDRLKSWISKRRDLAGRSPKKYASMDSAIKRMTEENQHLSEEMATHLTVHGVNQNEDGTFSWKFDNYVRSWPAYDMPEKDIQGLWSEIECPTLLVHGLESWASDPSNDGRSKFFRNPEVVGFKGAGHWVHHDCPDEFVSTVKNFFDSHGLPG